MTLLVDKLFNQGIASYFLVMLTIFILYMMFLAGIRHLLEQSIPNMYQDCARIYLAMKNAAEVAKIKLIKEHNDNQ